MFPQCKFSRSFYILATGSHGLGLVYSGFGYSFLILFSAFSARESRNGATIPETS